MYDHKPETPLVPPPSGIPASTTGQFKCRPWVWRVLRGWGSATCSTVTPQLLRVPASPVSHTRRGRAAGGKPLNFGDHPSPLSNTCPHLYLLAVWLWVNPLSVPQFPHLRKRGVTISALCSQVARGAQGWAHHELWCSLELSEGCKEEMGSD